MGTQKTPKPTKRDKAWQEKIEKNVKAEKVELSQPHGKERFEQILKRVIKK